MTKRKQTLPPALKANMERMKSGKSPQKGTPQKKKLRRRAK